ncbi:queuosine precursor transporter [Candidatus Peregrinibacteria bacterium]|jgi:queuosine precursor transporter|nr:queuosine precursor transporter [Candidatus Peregrinibacteria bacterium]MBT7736898.1 queuosine precursor transporter [Candidatus Peregrinibacteria bacterium]
MFLDFVRGKGDVARPLRHLTTIAVIFVSVLLISNVASSKIVSLGFFDFDGGTLLFPLSYIFGDVMTEVYGYKRTRKVIWLGLLMAVLMALTFMLVNALPAAAEGSNSEAFNAVLGWTPRIVLGSVVAYFFGEFSNSYLMAKIKIWMEGKYLFVRTISSTIVGEGIDTVIFVLIAFYGVLPSELLVAIIISNYIFKVGVEVLFTPFTYVIVDLLKKSEGIDVYDKKTNFNPFRLKD